MAERSQIEWTDATWNPWHGCIKVSPGCKNCYMYREKERYGQDPMKVVRSKTKFNDPLNWKEPRLVFTCSWSDFFIEQADPWRPEAWDIIKRTPHLTYQILTKRPELIRERLPEDWGAGYPNVWLGVSAENQELWEQRVEPLLATPAVIRFVSAEPLLGPINLSTPAWSWFRHPFRPLDWIIVGGESGPGARSMDLDWAVSIVNQCSGRVPVFVKQLGSRPTFAGSPIRVNGKGGDLQEWPAVLRVREYPRRRTNEATSS